MAQNRIINYTNVDFDSLRSQVEDFLKRDPRYENIRESSIAKTLLDVFAAMADFNNYYIERRAEESYLDTAKLRSSVIMLSRNLGYVVTRPVPAKANLSITLKGPLNSGIAAGDNVTFQKYTTSFTGEGSPFILKDTYTYTFTSADIIDGADSSWTKTISKAVSLSGTNDSIPLDAQGNVDSQSLLDIELIQGEIKTYTILGNNNKQVGLIFQQYNLDDTKFSNYYGEEDLGYNQKTDTDTIIENLTKVAIGTSASVLEDEDQLYRIRRRTITDTTRNVGDTTIPKQCLIRTNMSEGVELSFGDDIFADKGAANSSDNIYIQYFSTDGANANKSGIKGKKLTNSQTFVTNENDPVDVEFTFASNIINGSDMESIESIKLNASNSYYSLDRLVNARDYDTYLKTQTIGTSGQKVKNSITWGEKEELAETNDNANYRFFNMVLFSVLGKLYKFPVGGTYTYLPDSEIQEAYLEKASDFSNVTETSAGIVSADGYPEQSYFNVYIKEVPNTQVQRIEDYRTLDASHPILDMYDRLESRGQSVVNHVYISPIVQTFNLNGTVKIGPLRNRTDVQKNINNAIYTWLNENADFAKKIYKSSIYDIIQEFSSVVSSNIKFSAIYPDRILTDWESDPDFSEAAGLLDNVTSATLKGYFDTRISEYITSAGWANIEVSAGEDNLDINSRTTNTVSGDVWSNVLTAGKWDVEDVGHERVGNVNERSFYTVLMKNIYNDAINAELTTGEKFVDSQYFKNIMYKMNNDLKGVIRTSMLDSDGNITSYSFKNEIVQIRINLDYVFDS